MDISRSLARATAALVLSALAGCGGGGGDGGGGGGGGGGGAPLTYSGNTSPAVVSTSNASRLTANVVGGGDVSAATSGLTGGAAADAGQGALDVGRRLNRGVRASLVHATRVDGSPRLRSAIPIDDTSACSSGGTVRIVGTLSDGGTGTVSVFYTNCREGDDTLNGQAVMRIDTFVFGIGITDYTLSFSRLTFRSPDGSSLDMTGSLRAQLDIGNNSETVTENAVTLDNTGRMTKSENLVFVDVYNNIFSPTSFVESISGRVFDGVHGFVDITTAAPFVFATLAQPFPSSGEMLLTGASNSRIRATAVPPAVVVLALDLNGDGVFERQARLTWSSLAGPAGADLADSDGDGMHNSWETANGLSDAAGDPDGDGITNLAEYQAGTNPNVADATPLPAPGPGPLPPGPVTGQVIALANNSDLIFDSGTQRIYAAVRGNPGSLVPINPVTAAIGTAIPVGNDPVKLARSADGQYLYVGLDGQPAVQRINVDSQMVDLTITLGSSPTFPSFGPWYAEDIEVLPGSPQSIAVSLKYKLVSPRHAGVAIYDGSVPRPTVTPGHAGAGQISNVIEFSASAGTLYGYNNETTGFGFSRMAVDANGVTVTDVYTSFDTPTLISGFGTDIRFGGGFIFDTQGKMIDPIARTVVKTFALPATFGNFVVADAALNRVFYLTNDGSTWSIRAFNTGGTDPGPVAPIGTANITGVTGTPSSLIRWGAKGLAFRTSDGQIFMIESTSLIP